MTGSPWARDGHRDGIRAAIYLRVSTDDQHLSNQFPDLERLAKNRGLAIVKRYDEKASAWSGGRRLALEQMLIDAHRGEFDTVLIWALDRFTRRGVADALGILERLKSSTVEVISFNEPWLGMSGPMGDMMVGIFAALAQQESDLKSERVRAGMERAKAQGKHLGRPRDVVDETAISALLDAGESTRRIATILGLSRSMVRRRISKMAKPDE